MADNWQLKAVLSANAAGLIKTLDSVNKATRSTRKHLTDIGSGSLKLAGNLALPVGLLGSLAAGFSVAGIVQAAKNFAVLGDSAAKGSQKAGLGIGEFQQWSYVAGQSGVDVATLTTSMGRLNKSTAEAAAGKNKDLAGLFTKAGISLRGMNGELRNGSEVLPEIADLFARNTNEAVRARIGNAIFGKSWQELAPLLAGGSAGIAELVKRYKYLDIEVKDKAIKSGEAFGDQLDDLETKVRNYGTTVAAKLIPVLGPMVEKTIAWLVANRDLVTTKITDFVTQFAQALSKVDWNAVVNGIGSLVNGLKDLVNWFGGARNALIALVVFMNIQSILAFVSLTGSVFKLGASLFTLAATQIPAAIAGMGGLQAVMGATAFGAGKLLGILGQIALVAGAFWAGGKVGEYLINPALDWASQKLTGDKDATLGTALYGAFNADPMAQMDAADKKASLVRSANRVQASGAINVNFQNAPPGMRVAEDFGRTDVPINTNVGFSSFATGMPY
jgi:hypothetical protein